jgi:lysophospholipase L1-like esterase
MIHNLYRRCSQLLINRYFGYSVTIGGLFVATIIVYPTYLGTAAPGRGMFNDDMNRTTPFCNSSGFCGERPDIPSPRTTYSTHSAQQLALWYEFQRVLQKEMQSLATASSLSAPSNDHHVIVFWGDSITEGFRDTAYGQPSKRSEVANSVFGDTTTALFLGISGDQTQHVLYRINESAKAITSLSNTATAKKITLSFVVLIGTNNLAAGITPKNTMDGIVAVAESLSRLTNADANDPTIRILVLHILPRGDSNRLNDVCPSLCQNFAEKGQHLQPLSPQQPVSSFLPWIAETNAYLVQQERNNKFPPGMELLDCNAPFYADTATNTSIQVDLFVDRVHPNAKGEGLLAECVRDRLFPRTT